MEKKKNSNSSPLGFQSTASELQLFGYTQILRSVDRSGFFCLPLLKCDCLFPQCTLSYLLTTPSQLPFPKTLAMMSQAIINAIVQKAVEERLRQLGPIGTPQRNLRPWTPNNQFSFAAAEEQQPLAILDASSPQSASATWDSASPQAYLSDVTPTKKKTNRVTAVIETFFKFVECCKFCKFSGWHFSGCQFSGRQL